MPDNPTLPPSSPGHAQITPWLPAAVVLALLTLSSAFVAAGAATAPDGMALPLDAPAAAVLDASAPPPPSAVRPFEPLTSTTVAPTTTVPPTTAPPTTAPPTTVAPTTVAPTTVPPTIAPPATTPTPEAPPPVIVQVDPAPPPPPPPPPAITTTGLGGAAGEFLGAINGLRASNGAPALMPIAEMNNVAQGWADHMAATQTLAHNPNSSGQIPGGWSAWAENVGYGGSVGQVQAALVASPGHYRNMVNPDLRQIGIGVAVDGNGQVWTAHVFARY